MADKKLPALLSPETHTPLPEQDDKQNISSVDADLAAIALGEETMTGEVTNADIWGTDGNDTLHSTDEDDIIHGLDGDDELYVWGGDSSDYLDGGLGNDRFVIHTYQGTVRIEAQSLGFSLLALMRYNVSTAKVQQSDSGKVSVIIVLCSTE